MLKKHTLAGDPGAAAARIEAQLEKLQPKP